MIKRKKWGKTKKKKQDEISNNKNLLTGNLINKEEKMTRCSKVTRAHRRSGETHNDIDSFKQIVSRC